MHVVSLRPAVPPGQRANNIATPNCRVCLSINNRKMSTTTNKQKSGHFPSVYINNAIIPWFIIIRAGQDTHTFRCVDAAVACRASLSRHILDDAQSPHQMHTTAFVKKLFSFFLIICPLVPQCCCAILHRFWWLSFIFTLFTIYVFDLIFC